MVERNQQVRATWTRNTGGCRPRPSQICRRPPAMPVLKQIQLDRPRTPRLASHRPIIRPPVRELENRSGPTPHRRRLAWMSGRSIAKANPCCGVHVCSRRVLSGSEIRFFAQRAFSWHVRASVFGMVNCGAGGCRARGRDHRERGHRNLPFCGVPGTSYPTFDDFKFILAELVYCRVWKRRPARREEVLSAHWNR